MIWIVSAIALLLFLLVVFLYLVVRHAAVHIAVLKRLRKDSKIELIEAKAYAEADKLTLKGMPDQKKRADMLEKQCESLQKLVEGGLEMNEFRQPLLDAAVGWYDLKTDDEGLSTAVQQYRYHLAQLKQRQANDKHELIRKEGVGTDGT